RKGIMNEIERDKRSVKAANETLVIAQTEGGFRVYNPGNLTNLYMVSGIPDSPKCNCPDYEIHQSDADWQCKHILAVLNQMAKGRSVINGALERLRTNWPAMWKPCNWAYDPRRNINRLDELSAGPMDLLRLA